MPIHRTFPHYLGIYLVSKDRNGKELPKDKFDQIFEKVQAWFKMRFAGSSEKMRQVPTIKRGKGCYDPTPGRGLEMYDNLWEMFVYCTNEEFKKYYDAFITLAEEVQEESLQDWVMVIIDGKGYEVRKERPKK